MDKRSFIKSGVFVALLATTMCGLYGGASVFAAKSTSPASSDLSIDTEKSIGIILSNDAVTLDIQATPEGQFGRSAMTVNVSTNNATGYNLTMQASSDTLARSSQINGNSYSVEPITQSITCSSETATTCNGWTSTDNNKWGYRIDNGASYTAASSASAQQIKTTTGAANDSNTTIYFGAKLDSTLPAGSYEGVTLNFVATTNNVPWEISSFDTMQSLGSASGALKAQVFAGAGEGVAYEVADSRDGKTYTIAKLADGNIWMTENLALDPTVLTQAELYGTGDDAGKMTNASNTTLGYLKGTTSRDPSTDAGGKYATAGVSKAWTGDAQNLYSVPMIAVDSTTSGGCNNAHCVNGGTAGSPWSYSDSTSVTINGTTSRVQGKIGVYYNYCAASAGSYCYGEDASSGNATEDICPYGWHLPTGDQAQGSFSYLFTSYGANYNNFVDALSTPLSGYFANGKAYSQGRYGGFWSSTRYSSNMYGKNNMYRLYVGPSSVDPPSYDDRHYGYSVRCLFEGPKTNIDQIETLQDFANADTSAVANSMTEGTQYTKTDARDGKSYTIAKLADGNIWMTQNLDHDIVAQANYYTPENTDIPSAWTPSTATYATGTTTWTNSNTTPESYDPGDLCWNGTPGNSSTTTCGSDKHMSIGNYYNWTAALAMNDSSSYEADNTDVNQSICPAGWRLPISGTTDTGSKSFQYLVNQASLTAGRSGNIQLSPNYFVYGGVWNGSSRVVGSYGYYWSSVVKDSSYAYDLLFYSDGGLDPQDYIYRYRGVSVRCVAR